MSRNRFLALATGAAIAAAGGAWALGRTRSRLQPAYPPLDTPKQVAADIWIVDAAPIRAMGLVLPLRMTVIRLLEGELMLHSPTQWSEALGDAVAQLGTVRHMLAPSIGHWQFLADWQRAFPQATSWAVPGLRDRAQVRRSATRIDRELGSEAPPEWSEAVEQGLVRGAGFVESWFFHRPSRTLLLTDLIEQLEPAKLPLLSALAMHALRGTAGVIPLHVRATLLKERDANRAMQRHLVGLRPERVIFAHGSWFRDNAAERLQHAFRRGVR